MRATPVSLPGANGSVDDVVATEAEAFERIRTFLGFLPNNAWELAPVVTSSDTPLRRSTELDSIVPRRRRAVFDVRKMISLLIDTGTLFFELGDARVKVL